MNTTNDESKDAPTTKRSGFDWEAYMQSPEYKEFCRRHEELLANRIPNPRDIKFQRVVDRYNHMDEVANPAPGTVRYAWYRFKSASGELTEALIKWVRMIPCRLWWHSMPAEGSAYHSIKVCRRCGAWRES